MVFPTLVYFYICPFAEMHKALWKVSTILISKNTKNHEWFKKTPDILSQKHKVE